MYYHMIGYLKGMSILTASESEMPLLNHATCNKLNAQSNKK